MSKQASTVTALFNVWDDRLGAVGSPARANWSVAVMAAVFEARVKCDDANMREVAQSKVWARWDRSPPSPKAPLMSEDELARYIGRSLERQVTTLRRRRLVSRSIYGDGGHDVAVMVHGADAEPVLEEDMAPVTQALAFLDDHLDRITAHRRADRRATMRTLFDERRRMLAGNLSFADSVASLAKDGTDARTISNKLRQRYHRAGVDLTADLQRHAELVNAAELDVDALTRMVEQLFSDRSDSGR
jgi:hypothetical protein